MKKQLAIGSDHAGYEMKEMLKSYLLENGYTIEDFGTNSTESTDYPDYAHKVATAINEGVFSAGILICGSANGVCMTANKHQAVRCAIAWTEELAVLARSHNDANIIAIPARFIDEHTAKLIVDGFLSTSFEGGRHQRRVDKIAFR